MGFDFDPKQDWQHPFIQINHEIFSILILPVKTAHFFYFFFFILFFFFFGWGGGGGGGVGEWDGFNKIKKKYF